MSGLKTPARQEGAKTVPGQSNSAQSPSRLSQYTMKSTIAINVPPRGFMPFLGSDDLQQMPLPRNRARPLEQSSLGLPQLGTQPPGLSRLPHSPRLSRPNPLPGFNQLAQSTESLPVPPSLRFPSSSTVLSPQVQLGPHQQSVPRIMDRQPNPPYRPLRHFKQDLPAAFPRMGDPYHSLLASQVHNMSATFDAAAPASVGQFEGQNTQPFKASINDSLLKSQTPTMFSSEHTAAQAQIQSDSDDDETRRPVRTPGKSNGTNLPASVRPLAAEKSTPIQDIPMTSVEIVNNLQTIGNHKRKSSGAVFDEDDTDHLPGTSARDSVQSDTSDDQPLKLRSLTRRNNRSTTQTLNGQLIGYQVPASLQSTRIALGKTNWDLYISAVERCVDGIISEEELDREEKKLFMVPDTKLRLKIRKQMKGMVETRRRLVLPES